MHSYPFGRSRATWSIFEITRTSAFILIFPKKFSCNLTLHKGENFSDSFLDHILESEDSRFLFLRNIA